MFLEARHHQIICSGVLYETGLRNSILSLKIFDKKYSQENIHLNLESLRIETCTFLEYCPMFSYPDL